MVIAQSDVIGFDHGADFANVVYVEIVLHRGEFASKEATSLRLAGTRERCGRPAGGRGRQKKALAVRLRRLVERVAQLVPAVRTEAVR